MARDEQQYRGFPARREEGGIYRPRQEDWWSASPFSTLRRMQEEMDRWFGRGYLTGGEGGQAGRSSGMWAPHIDMWEENDQIHVRADVPGVEPEDLEVYCTEDSLIVRGESRSHDDREERGYHHRERRWGRFERTLPLPSQVDRDNIQASFRNGVLEIRMPCMQSNQERVKRIPIQGARQMTGAKGGETPVATASESSTASEQSMAGSQSAEVAVPNTEASPKESAARRKQR